MRRRKQLLPQSALASNFENVATFLLCRGTSLAPNHTMPSVVANAAEMQKSPPKSRTSKLQWVTPTPKPRPYVLQRDFKVLEREQRVTTILGSGAFRNELENILQGQLSGARRPLKPSKTAIQRLQDNVVPASQLEASSRQSMGAGVGMSHLEVIPINDLRGVKASQYTFVERQLRCKLAALCRLVDLFGWGQLIYNHVTARASVKESHFLVNPYGLMYQEVTASSLVKVDHNGSIVDPGSTQLEVNRQKFAIHSTIYSKRQDVKCVVHIHTTAGAAVSSMNCGLLPLSEDAMMLGEISYHGYRGNVWDEQEKEEVVRNLGAKSKVLILHNHGVVAMGNSIEEAFYYTFHLMRACEIQVAALSAGLTNLTRLSEGHGLVVLSSQSGPSSGSRVWRTGELEFEALMRMLDNKGYHTGYRYKGLNLLEPHPKSRKSMEGSSPSGIQAAKGDVSHGESRSPTDDQTSGEKTNVWTFLDEGEGVKRQAKEASLVSQEDPWGFLTPQQNKTKEQKAKNMRIHHSGPHVTRGITSGEDTSETELDISRPRQHQRPARYLKQPPHPLHDIHRPAEINPPPNLTPLELAQLTAEHVAHSTGKAVKKLAMQGGVSIPGERDGESPYGRGQEVMSRESDHVTVSVMKQAGDDNPCDTLAARNISSIHAMPGNWTTEYSPSGQRKQTTGYSKMDSSTESTRIQYNDQFLHHPARIHYTEGSSPAEKAAYAAKIVAGSTSTAVQKLSDSLTEKSTFSSSGFSAAVDGLGSPEL